MQDLIAQTEQFLSETYLAENKQAFERAVRTTLTSLLQCVKRLDQLREQEIEQQRRQDNMSGD